MSSGGADWRTVLVDLHDGESELAALCQEVANRHGDDRDLRDECRRPAEAAAQNVTRLAELGRDRGLRLDPDTERGGPLAGLRDRAARLLGGGDDQIELMLVNDMRRIYLTASAVDLDWRLLDEIGRTLPDGKLSDVAAECRPRTERQVTTARAQVLARGARILGKELAD